MNKLALCFFCGMFFAPGAFAADGATASRVIPSSGATAAPSSTDTARTAVARTAAAPSRTISRTASDASAAAPTRDTASVRQSSVAHRAAQSSSAAVASRAGLDAAVNTVGRNARVSAAAINNDPALRRVGVTLRPSTAEVGGRATIGETNIQTGSNVASSARSVSARAAAQTTRESIAEAKERLEQTAELNKSCQEQYNDCMDQFCAVVDANQKRCSCSANLSRYTKVENAVKEANTQLNDVAQRIRYVGLSADEIRAIMTATEAEEALSGKVDSTETRSMLDEIEKLIKDPVSATSYSADTYNGFDIDLDFSADNSDMFSLDFLNAGASSSFSNLRGTELYNAAKRRCNTILTQCKEVGATSQQITGNYDLAIDKDCIAYEQGLTKMNETLVSNVRSAGRMLQKARLAVLQNKNQYDAKGCIAALDACMTDDMVCGADYNKCLDPTKRYIDENGNVVLGQNITDITTFMENYNNADINRGFLAAADKMSSISKDACVGDDGKGGDGACNVKYLMTKIGTGQKTTDGGLCRAVLDKCQNYTYSSSGTYEPYNDVVVNYVQRAMVNIKAAQQKIISDYASTCMTEIATCYNQQVTQVNSWSSSATINSIYNVMRGACRNVALTCAYAVFQDATDNDDKALCPADSPDTCISNISEMFYQSLLCPENSTYQQEESTLSVNGCVASPTQKCYVNARCTCNVGYTLWGTACVLNCGANSKRNPTTGQCVCDEGYSMKGGICTQQETK